MMSQETSLVCYFNQIGTISMKYESLNIYNFLSSGGQGQLPRER